MTEYLRQNKQFFIILLMWLLTGIYGGGLVYLLLPVTLVLLKKQGSYQELMLGFLFILVLSDNLTPEMRFATNVKNIYVIMLALFLFLDTDQFYPLNTLYKAFLPFFVFSFICISFSPVFSVGFQKTISYPFVMIVIPNYFNRCYREHGQAFLKNIVFLGSFLLLAGLISGLISTSAFVDEGRFRGIFGNPNGLGLFCFVFFTLFLTINKTFKDLFTRKEKYFIVLVILLSVLLSNSRNALMGILILLVLMPLFKHSSFLGIVLTLLLAFSSIYIVGQIPNIIKALSLENYLRLNTLEELSGRSVAWGFAWLKIQNNFFIGPGFGYDEYIMRQNYEMLSKLGHQGGVHNSYLSLWLNFGLIGLVIYLCSFIYTFAKASKISRFAFPVMFAVMFSATFEGLLVGSLNPHMFILLIIMTILTWNPVTETEPLESEPVKNVIVA